MIFEWDIFVPIEPAPASRPKVSRYGVRYAKSHMLYQQDFREWVSSIDVPSFGNSLVEVEMYFFCTKARTSKLITPRYDVDNLVKLGLDCWTEAGLWDDDRQVAVLHTSKEFRDTPGTQIYVTKY